MSDAHGMRAINLAREIESLNDQIQAHHVSFWRHGDEVFCDLYESPLRGWRGSGVNWQGALADAVTRSKAR
jgi:hypothetical protein